MATIAVVIGGLAGFLIAFIGMLIGLDVGSAMLAWLTSGNATSLLIYHQLKRIGADDRGSVEDEMAALREAEARQATLAISDGSSMSRLLRQYAEQESKTASSRARKRINR